MGYNFYEFNSSDFEDLVQALFQKLLGNSSIVYGIGADGARELTYRGKASFESPTETHDGLWIVQAKFKSRDVHDRVRFDWVKSQFLNEMRKFKSGKYPVPDQYIFVTNCVLTPAFEHGGRDKMQSIVDMYKGLIPRIYIIAYDELCKLILNNADVRQAFGHFLHPGDQLAEIKNILLENNFRAPLMVAGREIRPFPSNQSNTTSISGVLMLNIDFGTTYSLGSVFNDNGHVELIPNVIGKLLLDSTVSFFKNGYYVVGNSSLKYAKSSEVVTIANVKRDLGIGKRYTVFGKRYSAEEVASLIVKSLKVSAEEYFGFEFEYAVVSKPSNYNIRQTAALHEVFKLAGLHVSRMLDEGTAPSYLFSKVINEYSLPKGNVTFLVVDLGGGTLDLSVQEYEDEVLETKAVLGDNLLGGIDYDKAVLEFVIMNVKNKYPFIRDVDFNIYLYEAERVKKALSNSDSCSFVIPDYSTGDGNLIDLDVMITRQDFKGATSKLNTRVMQHLVEIGKIAEDGIYSNSPLKIDAIMLTGQGSKIFTIKEIINNLFPGVTIIDNYMENAVCLGNAHQAGVLTGAYRGVFLLSAHNTSLAIRGMRKESGREALISVSSDPIYNTALHYIVKGSTTMPVKESFSLKLSVNDKIDFFTLPIYEYSTSSSENEVVAEVEIPVCEGLNLVNIKLDIDLNCKISLDIENQTMGLSLFHSII